MMRRCAILLILSGLTVLPAAAQTAAPAKNNADIPLETVTVTGEKLPPETIAHNFVVTFSAPSPLVGVIARWDQPICPTTIGLTPQFAEVVTKRVREVAAMVGAKVGDAQCRPNIWINFTPKPQELLEAARQKDPEILGYKGNRDGAMIFPVQAWYGTATVDIRGVVIPDDSNTLGMSAMPSTGWGRMPLGSVGGVPVASRAGSLARAGLNSALQSVYIVADLTKLSTAPLSAIADYAALLALSQTESYDVCQPLPSIANLLNPACDSANKPTALSATDIGYLRGVYKMDPGVALITQQSVIAEEMAKAMGNQ